MLEIADLPRRTVLRALVVSLCALPLLATMAGLPGARAVGRAPAVPHVGIVKMAALAVIGDLLTLDRATGTAPQGALSASVPGSLPTSAGPVRGAGPVQTAKPSCSSTVTSNLLSGGYSTKLLGLTTKGGQSAVVKQINTDCGAKKPVDQIAVHSLFNAKKPAVDASNFLFWGWFIPAGPASRDLKSGGYGPSPIALAMKYTYTMKPQPTAQVLKDLGFSSTQDMQALKDVFSQNAGSSSQILKNIGFSSTLNLQALKSVFKTTAAPGSRILAADGYSATQNGQALKSVFPTVKPVTVAGYLKSDGYTPGDIGKTLRDVYHVSAADMAQIFRDNGYDAHDNGVNLAALYSLGAGDVAKALVKVTPPYSILDIAALMKNDFAQTDKQTVYDLWGANFVRDDIAAAVSNVFAITVAGTLAQALTSAYGPCNTAVGTKSVFTSLDGAGLATALKSAFSSASDVATGINCVFTTYSAKQISPLLAGVSFNVGDTAAGLQTVFTTLPGSGMADALNGVFPIEGVADTVKTKYTLDNPNLTKAMKDGGFQAPDLGALLHDHFGAGAPDLVDAFSLAGFGGVPTVNSLKDKFGILDPGQALNLMKAKFSIGEIAGGLKDPYGLTQAKQLAEIFINNFDPEAIANVLSQVYSLALPDTVKAMFDANYPIDQVSRALDKYATPPDFNDIPGMLKNAGFPIPDIGATIHDYFNKPADVAAGYMKQFGAQADAIANLLKGKYNFNANDAAKLLAGLAFPMSAITPVLGAVFGVGADALKGVLEFAGFNSDDIDDFFDTLGDIACALDPFC